MMVKSDCSRRLCQAMSWIRPEITVARAGYAVRPASMNLGGGELDAPIDRPVLQADPHARESSQGEVYESFDVRGRNHHDAVGQKERHSVIGIGSERPMATKRAIQIDACEGEQATVPGYSDRALHARGIRVDAVQAGERNLGRPKQPTNAKVARPDLVTNPINGLRSCRPFSFSG